MSAWSPTQHAEGVLAQKVCALQWKCHMIVSSSYLLRVREDEDGEDYERVQDQYVEL